MPPRKKGAFAASKEFEKLDPEIEDEILEAYFKCVGGGGDDEEAKDQDLHLDELPSLFDALKIPQCFTNDIKQAIDYYYRAISQKNITIDRTNSRQNITMDMINSFTITSTSTEVITSNDILDIVDIDKLIKYTNRLVKFRNHFSHIKANWKLFLDSSNSSSSSSSSSSSNVESFRLYLPELKAVKTSLGLDNDLHHGGAILSDSFMIDMLGCCQYDSNERLLNYDFNKGGACVTIKDFAEILGRIGELD
ncbi:hypothetical protein KGF56_001032 [Candida oxycetoniae]|uniref:Uncharacterized protein n=1 Tax=Candida oxycetoniae TaxID=497107 RepID=A0AAI9WZS3_9ASCO|nr:uncharacterized protein KGF56_001032 [Candida oxycetoniae]KAI3406190.2 hypothetical protein KGF56_001032 [Candida oxycetoniae]